VPCEGFRYYVGLRCVTIPDVDCLGIESVQPDSPAALAGLRPGDVIMSVNGKPVSSEDVLTQELSAGQLNLEVFREGNESPTSIALLPQRVS
jgi:S1-C subfamily serine protease